MIYYICGKLIFKSPARVVVDNNGIGYSLNVSIETSQSIGEEGSEVKLFSFLQTKDDEVQLYGFASVEEKEGFKLLITVPNIGPKMALRILSGMNINQLYNAIIAEDTAFFTGIPGIGKKTGERIIVELKHRVEKLDIPQEKQFVDNREDFTSAVEALTVLGYKRKEAVSSVSRIMKENVGISSIEEIIKEALKRNN